jgi:hypothetical protein
MAENPFYARLVRDHSIPRLPGPIGVMLITALMSLIIWQVADKTAIAQIQALVLIPLVVLLLTPILTAGYAATLTANYTNTSEYAMLRVSPISHHEIVRAFARAVLFRLQMLFAVAIGLMPLAYAIFMNERIVRLWFGASPLAFLALLVGLLADSLAAGALGIALGLRLRRPVEATLIAVILFTVLPGLFIAAHPIMMGVLGAGSVMLFGAGPRSGVVLLAITLALPVVGLIALNLAEQWV